MEGFEHVVKVAMELENLIVTSNMKFPVSKRTRKKDREETQTHGYEIDLVGARRDKLVLASVKSYFGSKGVSRRHFKGLDERSTSANLSGQKFFNDEVIRQGLINKAAELLGYDESQIELRLYVGKFASEADKTDIVNHLGQLHTASGPVKVIDVETLIDQVMSVVKSKTYINDPIISLLKAMKQAGKLQLGD